MTFPGSPIARAWPAIGPIFVMPLGGGADDGPQLQAAITRMGAVGGTVYLGPGTFTVLSQITMLSPIGVNIVGTPATVINANIPSGQGAVFKADAWNPRTPVTTLAGPVTQGGRTLSLVGAGGLVNGSQILVAQAGPAAPVRGYTVVSGGGTTTITVDRPILPPFSAGSQVSLAGAGGFPTAIRFFGYGMTFTGSADYLIELIGGQVDCLLQDMVTTATIGHWAFSSDYAGRRGKLLRLRGSGSIVSWLCALEQNEGSSIEDCEYAGSGSSAGEGFCLNGGDGNRVVRCRCSGAVIGLFATEETTGDTWSARANVVESCNFSNNGTGIWIGDCVTDTEIIGCTADNCTTNAIILSPTLGTNPPNRVRVVGGSFKGAPVVVDGGANHSFIGADLSSGPNGVVISGLYATDNLKLDDCICDAVNTGGNVISIAVASGGANVTRTQIRGLKSNAPSASGALNVGANVPDLLVEDCVFIDAGSSVGGGLMVTIGAGSGLFTFRGCTFTLTSATGSNNTYCLGLGGSNVVDVDNCTFNLYRSAASLLIGMLLQGASTALRVRNTRAVSGGGAGGGTRYLAYASAAVTIEEGDGVDGAAFETRMSLSGGAQTNRGTVTYNGATGVDVSWSRITSNSIVLLTPVTVGGTPSASRAYTIVGGSKFTVTSAAGDTGVSAYIVTNR